MNKFVSPWDQIAAITGSYYSATATYPSGPEAGSDIYTPPASKFFVAGQGAPARHANYALKAVGDVASQGVLHNAMVFTAGRDWAGATIDTVAWSHSNRQFIVGSHTSATASKVTASRGPHLNGEVQLDNTASFKATNVLDVGGAIWEFTIPSSNVGKIVASTVTYFALSFGTVLASALSTSASIVIGTSGTATTAYKLAGTASTSLSTTTTGFDVSSTATWFVAQASPGSGPALFATRGTVGTLIWRTADGTSVTSLTRPDSTHYLAGLAWDSDQSLFVSCTFNAGVPTWYSSPDGITWTLMVGPLAPTGVAITSNVQFDICMGIWFIVGNQITTTNQCNGNGASLVTTLIYSLDHGQTWAVADLDMLTPSANSARITHADNRIMVWTDTDLAVSGRFGA